MTTTEEYTPGYQLDVHGDGDRGVVLLWHGKGARSRTAVAGLGAAIADTGYRVVVPDWDWAVDDGGRTALLASLDRARQVAGEVGTDPEQIVLVGWSLGGTAAIGLAATTDEPLGRIVLLAPADGSSAVVPFTGKPLPDPFPDGEGRPPVELVIPVDDDVVPPDMVRGLATRLEEAGWSTTQTDVEADHWSVAMTRFDEEADRPVAADDARDVGEKVAAIVAGQA